MIFGYLTEACFEANVQKAMGGAGVEREARNGVPPEGIPPSGMIAPAAASPPNAAVMGPKDGTMTAKNALNAVMGPKNGTMAALKSYGSLIFI